MGRRPAAVLRAWAERRRLADGITGAGRGADPRRVLACVGHARGADDGVVTVGVAGAGRGTDPRRVLPCVGHASGIDDSVVAAVGVVGAGGGADSGRVLHRLSGAGGQQHSQDSLPDTARPSEGTAGQRTAVGTTGIEGRRGNTRTNGNSGHKPTAQFYRYMAQTG